MATGTLQREILQTRPFSSVAEEAALGVLRTSDVLRRFLADVAHPRGITLQQYNVLRILRGAGPDGLPTLEIGARMIEEAPGITRLLGRLQRKALVKRHRCPKDARRVLCRITSPGLKLLQELDHPMRRAGEAFFAPLRADQARRLIRFLDAVRSPLTEVRSALTQGGLSR
jgi:MarR family transcriptional regulator, organic hydroperoxide resistance regulator